MQRVASDGAAGIDSAEEAEEDRPRRARPSKQIYLRTIYPLNPGIPHFVDVPGGW